MAVFFGETVKKRLTIRNSAGALANPTTISIRARCPGQVNIVQSISDCTAISTGVYDFSFIAAAIGTWTAVVTTAGNDCDKSTTFNFTVEKLPF